MRSFLKGLRPVEECATLGLLDADLNFLAEILELHGAGSVALFKQAERFADDFARRKALPGVFLLYRDRIEAAGTRKG